MRVGFSNDLFMGWIFQRSIHGLDCPMISVFLDLWKVHAFRHKCAPSNCGGGGVRLKWGIIAS